MLNESSLITMENLSEFKADVDMKRCQNVEITAFLQLILFRMEESLFQETDEKVRA